MALEQEQKVVFAIADDRKTLCLGVSESAWDYMKDGHTHTFDLQKLGIPVKIILYGGKTRADVLAPLKVDKDTLDVRGLDFGFGGGD